MYIEYYILTSSYLVKLRGVVSESWVTPVVTMSMGDCFIPAHAGTLSGQEAAPQEGSR